MLPILIQLALSSAIYGATCYWIMRLFAKADPTIPTWAAYVPFYNLFLRAQKSPEKSQCGV